MADFLEKKDLWFVSCSRFPLADNRSMNVMNKLGNVGLSLAATIVVDVPIEVAVERLVRFRSMTEADARARIERQASRETRLALATRVIDNSGDQQALAAQVADLWTWLQSLPPTSPEDLARYRAPRPKPAPPTPT